MWWFKKTPLTYEDLSIVEQRKARARLYSQWNSFEDADNKKANYTIRNLHRTIDHLHAQYDALVKELDMYKTFIGKINPNLKESK